MDDQHIITSPVLTPETKLYRYISFPHFVDIIEAKQISFSRIITWQDTWEVPSARVPMQFDDGRKEYPVWNIHESMFGQCWSLHKESDAMWRIYSPHGDGVVIETSVKKFDLLKQIKYAALGPVTYYDNLKEAMEKIEKHPRRGEYEIFSEAFLKRKAFAHENEVRFVTAGDQGCIEQKVSDTAVRFYVDVNPIEFIEGVVLDPRADDRHLEILQKYCKKAGFSIEPTKSGLYGNLYEQTGMVRRYITVKKQKK